VPRKPKNLARASDPPRVSITSMAFWFFIRIHYSHKCFVSTPFTVSNMEFIVPKIKQ
jgi:hypothetical protein